MSRYLRTIALAAFSCSLGACASDVAINSFRIGTHTAGLLQTNAGTNGYYLDNKKTILSSTVKFDRSLFFPSRVVAVFDLYRSVVLIVEGSSSTCGYRNQVVSFLRNSEEVYSTYIGICDERYFFSKENGQVLAKSYNSDTSHVFAYGGDSTLPVPVELPVAEISPAESAAPSSASFSEREERKEATLGPIFAESSLVQSFGNFVSNDYHASRIFSIAHPRGHLVESRIDSVSSAGGGGIVDQTFIWTYANTTFSTKLKYLITLRSGSIVDVDILIAESPTPSFPAFYAVTLGKEAAVNTLISSLKSGNKNFSALLVRVADKSITTPHAVGLALMLIAS